MTTRTQLHLQDRMLHVVRFHQAMGLCQSKMSWMALSSYLLRGFPSSDNVQHRHT